MTLFYAERPRLHSRLLLAFALLLTPGCTRPLRPLAERPAARQACDELLQLMQERLALMHDVARWKWNAKKPSADPQREQAFLKAIQKRCAEHGVDPALARTFFTAQIEAAKLMQEDDFRAWQAAGQGPFVAVADLATVVRPKIDALSERLVIALARVQSLLRGPNFAGLLHERAEMILVGAGVTPAVREATLKTWTELRINLGRKQRDDYDRLKEVHVGQDSNPVMSPTGLESCPTDFSAACTDVDGKESKGGTTNRGAVYC